MTKQQDENIQIDKDDLIETTEISIPKDNKKPKNILKNNLPLTIFIITSVVLIGLSITAILITIQQKNERDNDWHQPTTVITSFDRPMRGRIFIERSYSETETNVISGVVISTSDSGFVIAGNGDQYTIKTSSDTKYNTSAKKVSVNDSVTALGTLSGKTLTANIVRIVNQ